MLDRWDDEALVKADEEAHARRLERMRERRPQAGFAALISMLLAAAVMLILLAAFLPNSIRSAQVANNASAASWLAEVNTAEAQYAGAGYGGYVQPYALSGSLQAQVAGVLPCANPMLLPGVIAGSAAVPGAPTGYTLDFIHGAAATYTCTGGPAAAYQNYSITLAPVSKLRAGAINFFTCVGTGCDGQVHYASGRTAVESDPVWTTNIAAAQAGSGSGTGTSSGASLWYGVFSSTVTYPPGAMVTYGTPPVLYMNFTGTGNGLPPPQDTYDFTQLSSGALAQIPPQAGLLSGYGLPGNNSPIFWCPLSTAPNNCPVTLDYSGNGTPPSGALSSSPALTVVSKTWNVTVANSVAGDTITVSLWQNGVQVSGCAVTYPVTTCSASISLTMSPSQKYIVEIQNTGAGPSPTISWSVAAVQ